MKQNKIPKELQERIRKVAEKFSVLDAAKRCKVSYFDALKYSGHKT